MPRWNAKQERQYKKIVQSCTASTKRSRSKCVKSCFKVSAGRTRNRCIRQCSSVTGRKKNCKSMAAATVQKRRRRQ